MHINISFTVAKCSELTPPTHGNLDCSHPAGNFAWNSSCKFACKEGFVLKGSAELQCGASGGWNGQQPECEGIVSFWQLALSACEDLVF